MYDRYPSIHIAKHLEKHFDFEFFFLMKLKSIKMESVIMEKHQEIYIFKDKYKTASVRKETCPLHLILYSSSPSSVNLGSLPQK